MSGVVVDALDGRPLAGITVEIQGAGTATTSDDGSFVVNATTQAGPIPLRLSGDGYHTRETHVATSSSSLEPVRVDILPVGRGFDLDFFDHVFRGLGEGGTERWTQEPRIEIWTGVYERFDVDGFVEFEASGERAPERFVTVATDVILADARKYTGGVVLGSDIVVLPPHPPGTRLPYSEYFKPFTITVMLLRGGDASYGPSWPYESGRLSTRPRSGCRNDSTKTSDKCSATSLLTRSDFTIPPGVRTCRDLRS